MNRFDQSAAIPENISPSTNITLASGIAILTLQYAFSRKGYGSEEKISSGFNAVVPEAQFQGNDLP
ncbi:hypothetical protein CS542_05985 [Pedobacter sp. IW39]|nr:hypothetical protein CS542_05985 [Pedobacter sp. IW39]